MSDRLRRAFDAGLPLPEPPGQLVLWQPAFGMDLSVFDGAALQIVHDLMPDAAAFETAGYPATQTLPDGNVELAIVHLPRSKAAARDRIARAAQIAKTVAVDGQKTDGIDALLRDVRRRVPVDGTVSKSHGKLFWFSGGDFDDWHARDGVIDGRWQVAAGVFSADGIDPGSCMLAAALPCTLSGQIADLGAGWGFLAGSALENCPKISSLHLVEAQASALSCAKRNVSDPRARFHWADAIAWTGADRLDAVIMNPPFHTGRKADMSLGQSFVQSAARLLRKKGDMWMVANRHLKYEPAIVDHFGGFEEIAGDTRYKVLHARKMQ
ncbi:MAG: methyltransferase [Pseudomonadota bacterium]